MPLTLKKKAIEVPTEEMDQSRSKWRASTRR